MPSLPKIFGYSASPRSRVSKQTLAADDAPRHLESAAKSVMLMLDDDVKGAELELQEGNSVYHQVGLGLVMFMRATLGFERDIMAEASTRLATAGTAALEAQRLVQKDDEAFNSNIYPLGTEYSLCHAQAQIMSAVVGVLSESLPEAIKGFFKIRKSIFTLEAMSQSEKGFLQKIGSTRQQPPLPTSAGSLTKSAPSSTHGVDEILDTQRPPSADSGGLETDVKDDFVDAVEETHGTGALEDYHGHLETNGIIRDMTDVSQNPTADGDLRLEVQNTASSVSRIDSSLLKHPIDQFIHSGYCLNHGMLLLMLSLIPPSFTRILSIIGFRGNRALGLELLWEATRTSDLSPAHRPPVRSGEQSINLSEGTGSNGAAVHSGMAGLIVLGYYSGIVSTLDIVHSSSHPKARCASLLSQMRLRFPDSRLWLLEESRMAAARGDIFSAIETLESFDHPSQLKQVEGLRWFELSLDYMYTHQYEKCEESIVKCIGLNNWSHALYYYIAGAAHLDLYRMAKYGSAKVAADAADMHAKKAEDFFAKAPEHAGKKRLFAKQLPFDVFVNKKIAKWRERSEQTSKRLVDCVGVSPLEEMIFFWGGYKKMNAHMLQESLERLWFTDGGTRDMESSVPSDAREKLQPDPQADALPLDESAVLALLRSTIYRHRGDTVTARALLKREIIDAHKWEDFKGGLKDNWPAPISRYEMAVCAWKESMDRDGVEVDDTTREAKLRECSEYLEEAAAWERYDLDVRMGVKVTAGRDTLKGMGYGP